MAEAAPVPAELHVIVRHCASLCVIAHSSLRPVIVGFWDETLKIRPFLAAASSLFLHL